MFTMSHCYTSVRAGGAENFTTEVTGIGETLHVNLYMLPEVGGLPAAVVTDSAVVPPILLPYQTLSLIVNIRHLDLVLFLLVSSEHSS